MNLGSLFGGGDFKVPQSSSMTHLGVKERPRFRSTVTMHNEKSLPNNSQQQQQQQHRKRRKKKRRVRNKREGHSKRSDEDDDNDEEDDEEDEERGKVDDEISEEEDKRRFHQRQLSQLTSYNQKRRRRRQRSADLAGQFSTGIVEPGGVKNSSFSSSSSSGRGSAGSSSLVAVNVVPDIVITRDDEDYQDSAIHSGGITTGTSTTLNSPPSSSTSSHASNTPTESPSGTCGVQSGTRLRVPTMEEAEEMMRMKERRYVEDPDEILVVEAAAKKTELDVFKSRQRRSSSPFVRKDSFNRKMVSLLVIDGCEKCRERMEKEKQEQFERKEDRVKSQCEPDNWTYKSSPSSLHAASISYLHPITADSFSGNPGNNSNKNNNHNHHHNTHKSCSDSSCSTGVKELPALPSPFVLKPYQPFTSAVEAAEFEWKGEAFQFQDKEFEFPSSLDDKKPVLPTYLQNIIHHHTHIAKPQHDTKLLKKLSKKIWLPEDPEDPSAFTVTPGLSRPPKPPWCSSKPVHKIVGTFAVLMTLGIVLAIVYMNYVSDRFKPMEM